MIPEGATVVWRANPGPQTKFLASTAFEALYGGAAGGGKSDALLAGALRFVHVPSYRALLLRRTFPELQRSLIPKSLTRYLPIGATPIMSPTPQWRFPSGAVIEFGHLQHDHDVHKYQSAEYQFIGFDELTSFTEAQYVYMLSRLRTTAGIPVYVRAGTNPGGEGHEWVMKRWAPWLDPESTVKADPGEKLHVLNTETGPEYVPQGTPGALARVFFPARVSDNPHLSRGYEEILRGMDAVTRGQLLDGNWLIKPGAGLYFKRAWLELVERTPGDVIQRVRRWDLASTEGGGDWTVGVLMARTQQGKYVVEDVVRGRWRPEGVQQHVLATAKTDPPGTRLILPQDPGQAGKAQCEWYAKLLTGYNVRFDRESGDKVTRAQPFSAQCEARNVMLVRAPWNDVFVQTLEAFPEDGTHDDDVDAAAGAFNALVNRPASYQGREFSGPKRLFSGDWEDADDD